MGRGNIPSAGPILYAVPLRDTYGDGIEANYKVIDESVSVPDAESLAASEQRRGGHRLRLTKLLEALVAFIDCPS